MEFRWNDWNLEHIAEHGIGPEEAQGVVERASAPFPRKIDDEKELVWGPGRGGRLLQVIYVYSPGEVIYIIHARPLSAVEVRQYRRTRRRRGK